MFGDIDIDLNDNDENIEKDDAYERGSLVYHRLECNSTYQASLREGHTAVAYGQKMLVFGGKCKKITILSIYNNANNF